MSTGVSYYSFTSYWCDLSMICKSGYQPIPPVLAPGTALLPGRSRRLNQAKPLYLCSLILSVM